MVLKICPRCRAEMIRVRKKDGYMYVCYCREWRDTMAALAKIRARER